MPKIAVNNPNLSVILPVGCNAKCQFCYWTPDKGLSLDRFEFVAANLPRDLFQQVSITGGEPTLCKELLEYLKIAKKYFGKIVLNTNGYRLTQEHCKYADHVNISRHHFLDYENEKVFGTQTVPNTEELKELCLIGYNQVTLNCVLPDGFNDKQFISDYITYAKMLGAKVAFRKYFNNLNLLDQIDTDETLIDDHSCPACRHRKHIIDDVLVTFKYSVKETTDAIGGDIYELVLQSNGDLTYDWEGKKKVTYE